MFRKLTDFGYQRTPVQAIGFYLVYFFGGVIVSSLLGAIASAATGSSGFEQGMAVGLQVGTVFAILFTAALSAVILWAKGAIWNIGYLVVGVLSVAIAFVGGLLFGLILVAFLTTRPNSLSSESADEPIEGVVVR